MRLEIHSGLSNPVVINGATRIVVYDDMGNPVSFALSFHRDPATGREHIRCSHALDKDFENQLRMNGLKQTVIVERLDMHHKGG